MHDDLVKRFTAPGPNILWLNDITEHRPDEGKLHLCAIKDLWSNRIVGYSIDSNMKATLAVRALHSAIGARPHQGCVLHSDRGSQFRSKKFVRTLTNNGLLGSTGRVAAAPTMQLWTAFSLCCRRTCWIGDGGARGPTYAWLIVTWIERTYHRKRRQRRLGTLTPIEFETINRTADAA